MAVKKAVSRMKASSTKNASPAGRKTVKKTAPKKKVAVKKNAATTKKTDKNKKATTPRKKVVATKKAAPTKKAGPTKAVPKKKVSAKRKAPVSKKVTPKKTTPTIKKGSTIPVEPMVGTTLPVEGIDPYQPSPGESYMNEEQYIHFSGILIAWKKQLMEEVDRTVDHMKTDAANYADPADRATQEEEFSLELRTRDRERKLIKKIDESLVKIDSGDYGYCESCGIEIGIRRLEARPTATLCIDCKTLQEIKEKQIYS
jgi:DnaK suppressor protein